MRASIASVLEVDLQAVPHLTRTDGTKWFSVMYYFFIAHGYIYAGMWYPNKGKRKIAKKHSFNGFYLATVRSREYKEKTKGKETTHMVVMNQDWKVVHDPNPKKKWQGEILLGNLDFKHVYLFRKMNETDKNYWYYL